LTIQRSGEILSHWSRQSLRLGRGEEKGRHFLWGTLEREWDHSVAGKNDRRRLPEYLTPPDESRYAPHADSQTAQLEAAHCRGKIKFGYGNIVCSPYMRLLASPEIGQCELSKYGHSRRRMQF
jgi:hypothetical protein